MLDLINIHCAVSNKTLLEFDALSVFPGELFGLLGPNGAGKTTLLKTISGDMAYSGAIKLHGTELRKWSARERAKHLGVLPQASQLTFPFNAREVVELGLTPLSLSRNKAVDLTKDCMHATDCLRFADRPYPSLSGGERQRVQLARVLLQLSQAESTPLLLLDEPTSAQDLGQQHSILNLAKNLAKDHGFAVIAILHDLNQVLRYCDRCCLLDNGKIAGIGTPDELLTNDTIETHWQYKPERIALANGLTAVV